ncbi:MAG: hypothetical protein ACKV0T_22045 [Planctomycetales bacterium]
MDQISVVVDALGQGTHLIELLKASEFDVHAALWMKPTEEGKWFLYLVSPFVDERGPSASYSEVYSVLRRHPELAIDPLDVRVIGMQDSISEAVVKLLKPKVPKSPYVVPNLVPYAGITQFGGAMLGGVNIDGAYIYPAPKITPRASA